jgi:hypothetical protein
MRNASTAICGRCTPPRSELGIFRRRKEETLNEQMLREAGISPGGDRASPNEQTDAETGPSEPFDAYAGAYPANAQWLGSLTRAMARPGVWDLVTTVRVSGVAGDTVEFATLPAGDVIVDTETGDDDLSPFADEVEKHLKPPYRVLARREDDDLWAIAARTIDIVELQFAGGDEIELVENEGRTELRVGGELSRQEIPELERAGEALGSDFVVQADRLDGDLWEIRASAL